VPGVVFSTRRNTMTEQRVSSFSQTEPEKIHKIIDQYLREGWLVKLTEITFFQLGGTGIIVFERSLKKPQQEARKL
jgi:hypothetical protein